MRPFLTPLGLLTGKTAIKFADENGLSLNSYSLGSIPAKTGLSPDEAKRINPELIWIEIK